MDSEGNEEVTVTRSQDQKVSHDYGGKKKLLVKKHILLCTVDELYKSDSTLGPFEKFFDWLKNK